MLKAEDIMEGRAVKHSDGTIGFLGWIPIRDTEMISVNVVWVINKMGFKIETTTEGEHYLESLTLVVP